MAMENFEAVAEHALLAMAAANKTGFLVMDTGDDNYCVAAHGIGRAGSSVIALFSFATYLTDMMPEEIHQVMDILNKAAERHGPGLEGDGVKVVKEVGNG